MQSGDFTIEPVSRVFSDVIISAVLKYQSKNDTWDITVILGRTPGQELIKGKEVDAQLIDRGGKALTVIERPNGLLTEAGGSMGVSANARFRFQGSKERPGQLIVTYHRQTALFDIVLVENNSTRR
jgi:hypothetical protein